MKYLKQVELIFRLIECVLLICCLVFKLQESYITEIIVIIATAVLTTVRNCSTIKNLNKSAKEELPVPRLLEYKDFATSDAWVRYKHEYAWWEDVYKAARAENRSTQRDSCRFENYLKWASSIFWCIVFALAAFNT